jgi:DNA-binding PadR family transcriptional regulator
MSIKLITMSESADADSPLRTQRQRSPLGLMVLWQLMGEPMHVYRMQRLFEQQGKDRVINVRSRASLYQTIDRLVRLALVEVHQTVRSEARRPDRVVYSITDEGRETARQWLRDMLSNVGGEFPDFIAAVSVLFGLAPEDAQAQLELRVAKLSQALAETEAELISVPGLPRLFLLEEEYRRAVLEAELAWLRGVVEDIRSGTLTWSEEWLRQAFVAFTPPDPRPDDAQ